MDRLCLTISTSNILDIKPALIFGSTNVNVGQDLQLKCSINDQKSHNRNDVHVYLCKNGIGQRMELLGDEDDHIFILRNTSLLDSGNYSCVYSSHKYDPNDVKDIGQNFRQVQVYELSAHHIFPAKIYASTRVREGSDMEIKCSIFGKKHPPGQTHLYLCRNGVGINMKLVQDKEHYKFTISHVTRMDSGNYSCVYTTHKYKPSDVKQTGENYVFIQVYGAHPVKNARIKSSSTTVKKGDAIEVTCSISGHETPTLLYLYLCKDGVGKMSETLHNQSFTHFSIKNVNLKDSGNYSCLFSTDKYKPSEVNDSTTENAILIHVYDPQWTINLIRLIASVGVVVLACLIVIYDVKKKLP